MDGNESAVLFKIFTRKNHKGKNYGFFFKCNLVFENRHKYNLITTYLFYGYILWQR